MTNSKGFVTREFDYGTIIDFGKYKGTLIEDIFQKDPDYINWAAGNNHYFRLKESAFNKFKELNPNYKFSPKARKYTVEYIKESNANGLEFMTEDWPSFK